MSKIEKQLKKGKAQLRAVTAPKELEDRLSKALDHTPDRRRKSRVWLVAAALAFFTLFIGYHYNTFAFYGKKLIGFEEVMTGTLQDLNEQGMGQIIDESTDLTEGSRLYIDGVMADENQLVLYYTIKNPDGVDNENLLHLRSITGFLTNSYTVSGTAWLNDSKTEIKGMQTFYPVNAFSKKLTLHFSEILDNEKQIERNITFTYNPNKAFRAEFKQSLKKTVKVDKGEVRFQSIIASPTITMIKGRLKVENFDRVPLALEGIDLIANGQPLEQLGSGITTSLRGSEFELRYDALPDQLESLQLVMKEFVGYQPLNEKISLAEIGNRPIEMGGKTLDIQNIHREKDQIKVTITTAEDVMLEGVSLESGGEVTPLQTTVNQKESKQANGDILKERTLVFKTEDPPEHLIIKGMHYMKEYQEKVEIPVSK
ncbi:hypothetical protein J14TS2_44430 [Bacillus sp. J14TS2]|uniref:DUF4179 domain-containing protein n=1 Tax=Bacillus sp. J14TS2 TaxID=2807188 RepID=UPI001B18F084|nr:DUF4179 domain-containing protein [Bacillus sp. J14TS2]GIN73968.1 hypothetical protein J14TS2_44430 [Bacillus sp. J14TS2]